MIIIFLIYKLLRGTLKFHIMIVDLPFSLFISVEFFFIYFAIILFGVYNFEMI